MLLPDEAAFASRAGDLRDAIADLALARFGNLLPPVATGEANTAASDYLIAVPVEAAAREALAAAATPMLTQAGLWAMIPGSHDRERESVEVPVLCSVAEFDITGDPAALPGFLPRAPVEVFVLPAAGHNANVAPGRADLWEVVARWCLTRVR
jgi:pimeloyl-ACP methyl ester carboxylesterase